MPGHYGREKDSSFRRLDEPTKEVARQRDINMRLEGAKSMAQAGIRSIGGTKAGPGSFTITDPGSGEKTTYTTTTNEDGGSTTTTTNEDGGIISQVTTDEKGNLVPQEKKTNFLNKVVTGAKDAFEAYKNFGGIFGLPVSVLRLLGDPRASQFSDPNALAIIRSLFTDEQGNVNQKLLEGFYDDYKDIIEEGIQDRGVGSLDAAQRSSLLTGDFDDFKNLIMSSSPTGIEGMESERRLDPVNYVIDDGKINVPQTTGQAIDFVNTLNFDDIEKAYSEGKISKEQRTRLGQVLEESRALANEARSREARDIGNMQSPAFAPTTQPGTQPPGTQPPGTQPPGTPPIPFPVATGAGITPFNINQFYASLPQYTQQGIMSPSLAQYFQNLQAFPRIV